MKSITIGLLATVTMAEQFSLFTGEQDDIIGMLSMVNEAIEMDKLEHEQEAEHPLLGVYRGRGRSEHPDADSTTTTSE